MPKTFPRLFRLPALRWDHSFALALAFFANALLLIFLGLPRRGEFTPYLPPSADPVPYQTIEVKPEPLQPVPIMPVPPVKPTPQQAITAPIAPIAPPMEDPVFSVDTTGVNETTSDSAMAFDNGPVVAAPSQGVGYLIAPTPRYPPQDKRRGHEGVVMLRVLVGADGRPREVRVDISSGHRGLDSAAQDQVFNRWRFQPAQREGVAVEAWVRVPIEFRIDHG